MSDGQASFVMIWMAIRSAGINLRFMAHALIVQRKTKKTLLRKMRIYEKGARFGLLFQLLTRIK